MVAASNLVQQPGARSPVQLPSAHGRFDAAYTGPRALRGRVTLGAQVQGGAHIVAVTYMLGGEPLGSATAAPWSLDLNAALLSPGRGVITVAAVDRLGHSALSGPTQVDIQPGGQRVLHASPRSHLGAALRALARGSVLVQLAPGTYRVGSLVLGPGARLDGSGPSTILTPSRGTAALLRTSSSHVRISDLSVDGRWRIDQAVSVYGASDVRIQRITVSGVRSDGVEFGGPHSGDSVQDSTLYGRGVATDAGVFDFGSPNSSQTSVIRTRISGFRGYGILFAQRFHGLKRVAAHNLALENRISDIIDPTRQDGTDEGGIWTGGVQAAVIGNSISHTGIDGVETVGSSTGDTIVANDVWNTHVAIYLEHSTNRTLVSGNHLWRAATGINVEYRYGGVGSNTNTLSYNSIAATRVGVFVDVQEDYNSVVGNVFTGRSTPVILQGSSFTLVRGNVTCAVGRQPVVVQQPALSQTGGLAWPSHNRLVSNGHTGACAAP